MRSLLLLLATLPTVLLAEEPPNDDQTVIDFMTTNCYACHGPMAREGERVAPPMIAVKRHYLEAGLDREQFIEAIAGFVAAPSEDKSRMPGAVRRFGVMPPALYDDAMVRRLAGYVFDNEIDKPEWFEAHWANRGQHRGQGMGPGRVRELPPAERGRAIANATKAQLGKSLMGALDGEGAAHAVAFCNEQALPMTAAMEKTHEVSIRRVSDRPRNPANAADPSAIALIALFQAMVEAGEPIEPLVATMGDTTTTYLPIVTNAMCLQCHGSVEENIEPETLARIQSLYPDDQATGYGENQVRGLWQIRWERGG